MHEHLKTAVAQAENVHKRQDDFIRKVAEGVRDHLQSRWQIPLFQQKFVWPTVDISSPANELGVGDLPKTDREGKKGFAIRFQIPGTGYFTFIAVQIWVKFTFEDGLATAYVEDQPSQTWPINLADDLNKVSFVADTVFDHLVKGIQSLEDGYGDENVQIN